VATSAKRREAPVTPQIAFADATLVLGGKTIIENLTLDVRPGEFLCIVGASGCGKTTALRLAAGLYQPTSGAVTFDGEPMREPRREIAIVFQDYGKALLPWRTASRNVSLALEAMGMPAAQRPGRIDALLRKVGLPGHAGKYPTEMSGGMQRRLQIARCLEGGRHHDNTIRHGGHQRARPLPPRDRGDQPRPRPRHQGRGRKAALPRPAARAPRLCSRAWRRHARYS
jgi:NitT/TauT family transport system ATP-binding protein